MKYFQTIALTDDRTCVIRNGTEQDAEAVLSNFILTHTQTDFLTTYPEETTFTVDQEKEYLKKKTDSEREIELVAEVDGKIVGTAGVDLIRAAEKTRHRASFGISIEQAFWGIGIGWALTSACIECAGAAGYSQIELEVVADNRRALALYQRAGYVEYGRNPRGFRSRKSGWQETVLMRRELDDYLTVCGKTYHLIRLLGHGKGGYSYLAECDGQQVVLKLIHHEPCSYYSFGNKIEAECRDYQRLKDAGIRIPTMIAVDRDAERIIKEYIEGDTVFEHVRKGLSVEPYLPQVREMAGQAKSCGLNIDYFPTNFVVRNGLIWYIDYECNDYMDEWSFENWGIKYWSRTPEFEEYLRKYEKIEV